MLRENVRKSIKERILFALTLGTDFLNSRDFSPFLYQDLYWILSDVAQTSIRSAISELVSSHYVSSYRHDGQVKLTLTSTGREYLLSKLHIEKAKRQRWDQTWRVVVFSGLEPFPKAYRLLRTALSKHEFVQVERGVYMSPFPVSETLHAYLVSHDLQKCSIVLETRRFLYGDEKTFASIWWNLERVSEEYTKLSKKTESLLKLFKNKKRLNNREKGFISTLTLRAFIQLNQDPGIPTQLLPPNWAFEAFYSSFIELSKTFVKGAK